MVIKWKKDMEREFADHTFRYTDFPLVSVLCTPLPTSSLCVQPLVQIHILQMINLKCVQPLGRGSSLATWGGDGYLEVKLLIPMAFKKSLLRYNLYAVNSPLYSAQFSDF